MGEVSPIYIDGPLKGGEFVVTIGSLQNGVTCPAGTWYDSIEERVRTDSPAKEDTHYFVHLFPLSPGRNVAICSVHNVQAKLNWNELFNQMLSEHAKKATLR